MHYTTYKGQEITYCPIMNVFICGELTGKSAYAIMAKIDGSMY